MRVCAPTESDARRYRDQLQCQRMTGSRRYASIRRSSPPILSGSTIAGSSVDSGAASGIQQINAEHLGTRRGRKDLIDLTKFADLRQATVAFIGEHTVCRNAGYDLCQRAIANAHRYLTISQATEMACNCQQRRTSPIAFVHACIGLRAIDHSAIRASTHHADGRFQAGSPRASKADCGRQDPMTRVTGSNRELDRSKTLRIRVNSQSASTTFSETTRIAVTLVEQSRPFRVPCRRGWSS